MDRKRFINNQQPLTNRSAAVIYFEHIDFSILNTYNHCSHFLSTKSKEVGRMKKTINILTIMSIVLSATTLLLFIAFVSVFWEQTCLLFSDSHELIEMGPTIPLAGTVSMVGRLLISIFIFAFRKTPKFIAIEIFSIVFLAAILPISSFFLSLIQNSIVSHEGILEVFALNVTTNINQYASKFATLCPPICFIVCGMRLSEKIRLRKLSDTTAQGI